MFHLPTLQPCDGLPLWIMTEDDLTQGLVLWWPSGTAWVVHGPSSESDASATTPDNHVDAA
jgi:hypothetical protein